MNSPKSLFCEVGTGVLLAGNVSDHSIQSSPCICRERWLVEVGHAPLPLAKSVSIMWPFPMVANEPKVVFGGQLEVMSFRRGLVKKNQDWETIIMNRVIWCLVAGVGFLLPVSVQAKDCCKPVKCKVVKVKCCQPVAQTCCQKPAPTCCQAQAACCTSSGAAATPALSPSAGDAKKTYEEPAAPPPPAEKKAEEPKK